MLKHACVRLLGTEERRKEAGTKDGFNSSIEDATVFVTDTSV